LHRARLIERGLHVDIEQPLEVTVLLHAEDLEASAHLVGADLGHALARPAFLVHGAALAPGGGDVDDAVAGCGGQRHQPRREVDIIVRVGPDAEDRAEILHGFRRQDTAGGSPSSDLIRCSSAGGTSSPVHFDRITTFTCLRNSARCMHGLQSDRCTWICS
jgi:hypothetical protein